MVSAQTLGLIEAFVEIAIGGLLVLGMVLVRRGRVRAHMIIQSSMVLVNIPIVLATMVPMYLEYVWPGLPSELGEPFYLAPTIMLLAGIAAETLGVYILLVAGTNLVPERFRFRRFKLWMRTELVLWWGVILTGLTTFVIWNYGLFSGSS